MAGYLYRDMGFTGERDDMSTELGEITDCQDDTLSIEVAMGVGGIRLFSSEKKIWLDCDKAKKLIELLEEAIARGEDRV